MFFLMVTADCIWKSNPHEVEFIGNAPGFPIRIHVAPLVAAMLGCPMIAMLAEEDAPPEKDIKKSDG